MKNKLITGLMAVIMAVAVFSIPSYAGNGGAEGSAETGWSEWSTEEPGNDIVDYEEAVFHRYRIKDYRYIAPSAAIPEGYTKDEDASNNKVTVCYKMGSWSKWYTGDDWTQAKNDAVKDLKGTQEFLEESVTKYRYRTGGIRQKVTVSDSFSKVYGDEAFPLNASAETRLEYRSSNADVIRVSENGIVEIKGAGKAVVTVTAAAENGYEAASKNVSINIAKAKDKISCSTVKYSITYGTGKGKTPFSLNASANTVLSYKSSNRNIATVSSSGKVTVKNPGKAVITISSAGDSNYTKAAALSVELNVRLKKPVISVKATGKKVARITPVTKTPGAEGYETWVLNPGKSKYTKLGIASSEKKYFRFVGSKGKTYKVKVRACRKVSGKYVYSSFSSVKSVKIK